MPSSGVQEPHRPCWLSTQRIETGGPGRPGTAGTALRRAGPDRATAPCGGSPGPGGARPWRRPSGAPRPGRSTPGSGRRPGRRRDRQLTVRRRRPLRRHLDLRLRHGHPPIVARIFAAQAVDDVCAGQRPVATADPGAGSDLSTALSTTCPRGRTSLPQPTHSPVHRSARANLADPVDGPSRVHLASLVTRPPGHLVLPRWGRCGGSGSPRWPRSVRRGLSRARAPPAPSTARAGLG